MKNIGIVYHPKNLAAPKMVEKIESVAANSGCKTWLASAWETDKISRQAGSSDLIITVGGDGTILRTVHAVMPDKIPIIGVNLGRLGFLTEIEVDEVDHKLPAFLQGEGWIDKRSVLETELTWAEESDRTLKQYYWALNDVVIARGEVARVIHINVCIDDEPLSSYQADGIIIASATGSTGYALAAGGPVMHPQSKEFLLVPILPHLNPGYNVVVPKDSSVEIKVNNLHPATLNIDGHISQSLPDGATITTRQSPHEVHFLRSLPQTSFFSTLEKRLRV